MTSPKALVGLAVVAVAGLTLLLPSEAGGHALLSSSEPGNGERVESAPGGVVIGFTEEPDLALSSFQVLDVDGEDWAAEARRSEDPQTVVVPLRDELAQGVYTVSWRVISVVDGHLTSGAFSFGVGVDPVAVQEEASGAAESPFVGTAGRWLFYVGLAVLAGAAAMSLLAGPPVRRYGGWVVTGVALSVLGLAGLALGQLQVAGVPLGDFVTTSTGRPLLFRGAGVLGATAGALWLMRSWTEVAASLVLLGVSAAAIAHAAAGHAAAAGEPLAVGVHAVHFLGGVLWSGALAALLFGWLGDPERSGRAAHRYSRMALIVIAVVGVTGVLRAVREVGSWGALISEGYGRWVSVKVAALVLIVTLGALNRFRFLPRLAERIGSLRRAGVIEVMLAVGVFVATGFMAQGVPPATVAQSGGTEPVVVSGTDFGGTTEVELTITPGRPGPNRFVAVVTDAITGEPMEAELVRLRFTYEDARIGESRLDLVPEGDGVYSAKSAAMALGGDWTVTVLVQRATTSAEIDLEVALEAEEDRVVIDCVPGQPTLYTVKVGEGRTAQIYTDPEQAGFSQLHLTYFSPEGGELDVAEVQIEVVRPSGGREGLEPRRFGPGHFVADIDLVEGEWLVDAGAITAADEQILAALPFEIGEGCPD